MINAKNTDILFTMSRVSYLLNWISPSISQQEIEALYNTVNALLSKCGTSPIPKFTQVKVLPLFKPSEAILLQFPVTHLNTQEANVFRDSLWLMLLKNEYQPRPFAVSLLPESTIKAQKQLLVFDMDSTLINQEVIDELARTQGKYEEVSKITEEAMRGNLSFTESLKARCKLLKGLSIYEATNIIPSLSLSPGADELLKYARLSGIKTAVVSGGFDFILRHFQKQCDLDHVYGNNLERDDEDQFTGDVLDPIVDATYKQKLVANLKSQYGFTSEETVVMGDGANDIPMMTEAGTQVSFCGKPKLNASTNTLILDRNLLWILPLL